MAKQAEKAKEAKEAKETKETPKEQPATEAVAEKASTPKKKKIKRSVPSGTVYIHATFNNTIITVTDPTGNVLAWSSAGSRGFKGARKGTPFAAQLAAEDAAKKAVDRFGVRTVDVLVSGPGGGRESSLRSLQSAGFRITSIQDITPIPHNGCRPAKRRRV